MTETNLHTREKLRDMFDIFIGHYQEAVEQALCLPVAHINPLRAHRAIEEFLRDNPTLAVRTLDRAGFCPSDFHPGAGRRLPLSTFDFRLQRDCRRLIYIKFNADAMWDAFSPALRCADAT